MFIAAKNNITHEFSYNISFYSYMQYMNESTDTDTNIYIIYLVYCCAYY